MELVRVQLMNLEMYVADGDGCFIVTQVAAEAVR